MSNLQYGLPSLPAATDIDQDSLVKEVAGEFALVDGASDVDVDDNIGALDVDAAAGDPVSPKRGPLVDYVRLADDADVSTGDLLQPGAGGTVDAYDDDTTGNVAIARCAGVDGDRVRLEFLTLPEVAA